MALVTIGTDGVVDYVQVPDGQKFCLGPVSVLRLITGAVDSVRTARVALQEFVETGKTMVSVDLDRMWELLPFRRARYSSTNPLMLDWDHSPAETDMKIASYDTLIAHVEMAEDIVSKVAETNETIDRLVSEGKRFDSERAKADLLKIASLVSNIAQNVDMAQPWVGYDLAELSSHANSIHELFPVKVAARESDIVHENGNHWVTEESLKGRTVYKVWRGADSGTHGKLVGTFDLGDRGRARAIEDCDRREEKSKTARRG